VKEGRRKKKKKKKKIRINEITKKNKIQKQVEFRSS